MNRAEDRRWLAEEFFSGSNLLQWSDIDSGELSPGAMGRLRPWLEQLLSGREPVVLPFVEGGGRVSWYLGVGDARRFRHLREEVVAFLGPTYSDYEGQPSHLDSNTGHEAALQKAFGSHVVRLEVRNEHHEIVRERLELLLRLREESPERVQFLGRPTGRVLSDFEEALRLGDDTAAADCLGELEQEGHVDAQNLLYLRLRCHEARGSWQEILDAEKRYHLLSLDRRPPRVSQALLRAHYATSLMPFELANDAQGAVACFERDVWPRINPLLASRAPYACPEADAVFMMLGLVSGVPGSALDDLLTVGEGRPHHPWLMRLRGVAEGVTAHPQDDRTDNEAALSPVACLLEAGEFDSAWDLILQMEVTEDTVRLALQCAYQRASLSAARIGLGLFAKLPGDSQERLQESAVVCEWLESLTQLCVPLQSTDDRLREHAALAARYASEDPAGSLHKSRVALERIVKASYQLLIGPLPKRNRLNELLGNTQFKARVPDRILARMGALQLLGNLGSHDRDEDELPKESDARRGIQDLGELIVWFEDVRESGHQSEADGSQRSTSGEDSEPPEVHVPDSWLAWVEAVTTQPEWTDAVLVAERGAVEWSPEEFASGAIASAMTDALSNLDSEGERRLREALPFLLDAISRCDSLPRSYAAVLEILLLVHLMDPAPGRLCFATLADLVQLTLGVGIDEANYSSVLSECIMKAGSLAAPASFDGMLELLNTFVSNASPRPDLVMALAATVADALTRFARRVEPTQALLVRQLLVEANCEIPQALRLRASADGGETAESPLLALQGQSIALYSLNEHATRRVARLLEETVPGMAVQVFHDKVGRNPALRAAARHADVFVVATASATHAATRSIEAERKGAPTLKPAGQGSASMLRALLDYASATDVASAA